jgi:hypothetical protein
MLIGTDELTIATDCNRTSTTDSDPESEVPSSDNSDNFRVIYSQIVKYVVHIIVIKVPRTTGNTNTEEYSYVLTLTPNIRMNGRYSSGTLCIPH